MTFSTETLAAFLDVEIDHAIWRLQDARVGIKDRARLAEIDADIEALRHERALRQRERVKAERR
jgi:hypothetical protein